MLGIVIVPIRSAIMSILELSNETLWKHRIHLTIACLYDLQLTILI